MSCNNTGLLQCYNRGCGQKYDSENNHEGTNRLCFQKSILYSVSNINHLKNIRLYFLDSCRHHPGEPVFHDAYKGWGCCNKKCTDFTEFLNIKGCTLSKHSNIKPPEPEKPVAKDIPDTEVIEVKPLKKQCLERPPHDTPLVSNQCHLHIPTFLPQLTWSYLVINLLSKRIYYLI